MGAVKSGAIGLEVYFYQLGARVKIRRTELGLTLIEFADRCGFDQPYASRLEAGKVNPTYLTILRVAGVLKVPAEYLTRTEVPPMVTPKVKKKAGHRKTTGRS